MDIFAEQQYIVERLDGDYAYLKNLSSPEDELKCVARALLPEVGEGIESIAVSHSTSYTTSVLTSFTKIQSFPETPISSL